MKEMFSFFKESSELYYLYLFRIIFFFLGKHPKVMEKIKISIFKKIETN